MMRHALQIAVVCAALAGLPLSETFAQSPSTTPSPSPAALMPGTVIDANNVAKYVQYLPAAAEAAVRHGLKIQVVPARRQDWSAGFTQATEKYSSQVGLDTNDYITNYVAGAPFPTFDITDPKAAVKIAYNWHMGPFMPDDFSLSPWGSFGYSEDGSGAIQPEEDNSYICNQFSFLRFAHRTEVDPRPTIGSNSQGFEWKARCTEWTATPLGDIGEGSGIWIRYLEPQRGDEFYGFNPETRRLRRTGTGFAASTEGCRSCHQPYWAYALPKTEDYSYRVLGTASLLACLNANEEPAGLQMGEKALSMREEPFELRNAYILEMRPKANDGANLRTLVFVDTEAYVWIAAEFFDGNERTAVAIPLWRSRQSPGGGNLFDLAGEFYVPYRQIAMSARESHSGSSSPRWFFRTLVPAHGDFTQKIDSGDVSEAMFNPQSLSR